MGANCDGNGTDPNKYTMWNNLDQDVKDHAVSKRPVAIKLKYLSQSKCSGQFDLTKNGSDIILKMRNAKEEYQTHEFCVIFNSDGTMAAKVAQPKVEGGGGGNLGLAPAGG